MEANKRLATLEQEFKLIKGEVKETLCSLRDYLISVKLPLPPVEQAEMLGGIGDGEKSTMEGNLNLVPGVSIAGAAAPVAAAAETQMAGAGTVISTPGISVATSGAGVAEPSRRTEHIITREVVSTPLARDELGEPAAKVTDAPVSAPQREYAEPGEIRSEGLAEPVGETRTREEPDQAIPQVNLMANLIRWVANAKREIDDEQLPVFLEVYGISGYLSPELKEVILHLADITEPQSADAGIADTWSRLTLELHGILTGGDAPLYPVKPFWKDEGGEALPDEVAEAEVKIAAGGTENKPLTLKMVFTDANGEDKEFSINLTPEMGNDNP